MVEERPILIYILIAAAIPAAIVLAVVLISRPRPAPPAEAVLFSDEQKAYLSHIVVTDARMSAAENFLGHTVIYLDGQVLNQGTKPVKQIELQLEFVDTLNQVVLRERVYPLIPHTFPLKPGEARTFQVSFDHMPAEWNQAPPRIAPIAVRF